MERMVIVDSGRNAVKTICNDERLLFPSVVSPAHEFNMDVDLNNPEFFWINLDRAECFVGKLATKQSDYNFQDRTRDKTNGNNKILIATAVSMFAEPGESITLITNIPARDWKAQKADLAKSLKGSYRLAHKAGIRQGMMVEFMIDRVYPLPEGAGAFYGYVYDKDLNILRPDYLDGRTLVLDIGDETINYVLMEDGEYLDQYCSSIDSGLRVAHANVLQWVDSLGLEISLAKLTEHIRERKPVYIGSESVEVHFKAYDEYELLAKKAYYQLQTRLPFASIRNVLCCGGGSFELGREFKRIIPKCNIDYLKPEDGQWLNAKGFEIMFKMAQEK